MLCSFAVLQFCSFAVLSKPRRLRGKLGGDPDHIEDPDLSVRSVWAVLQSKKYLILKRFPSHPGPHTTHLLEAVAETDHEIKHLRGIISPLVIAVPGNIIDFQPERKDLCIAVFSTQSNIDMNRLFDP